MRGESRASLRSGSRYVVQDTGGKTCVGEALRNEADCQRRLVRRLRDERTAGGERGADFPRVDVDRVIPWRDSADDADRGRDDQAPDVLSRGRPDAAADPSPFLRVVMDHLDAETDFLLRVWDRLALLSRQEIGDRRQAFIDQVGGPMQNTRARIGVGAGPTRQSPVGRLDG